MNGRVRTSRILMKQMHAWGLEKMAKIRRRRTSCFVRRCLPTDTPIFFTFTAMSAKHDQWVYNPDEGKKYFQHWSGTLYSFVSPFENKSIKKRPKNRFTPEHKQKPNGVQEERKWWFNCPWIVLLITRNAKSNPRLLKLSSDVISVWFNCKYLSTVQSPS